MRTKLSGIWFKVFCSKHLTLSSFFRWNLLSLAEILLSLSVFVSVFKHTFVSYWSNTLCACDWSNSSKDFESEATLKKRCLRIRAFRVSSVLQRAWWRLSFMYTYVYECTQFVLNYALDSRCIRTAFLCIEMELFSTDTIVSSSFATILVLLALQENNLGTNCFPK